TKDLVPPQELRKTKDHMIGKMVLGLETSDEIAGFYGGQEILTKKLKEPNEVIRDLKAVTAEEIRAVARALFTDRRLNFAVIGPYAKDDSFRRALHF
ncbi:MAG: insulinase family protein, partial [Patescibacteria group bacterium]